MKEHLNLNYERARCVLNSLLTVFIALEAAVVTTSILCNFKSDILTELVYVWLRLHSCFCQMMQPTQSDLT